MTSIATPRNRLNLQGTGDNTGSWGTVLNAQVFTLLDESLDAVATINLSSGNVTLSSANYATDQSRKRTLKLTQTGTPTSYQVTLPAVEKFYVVHNTTSAVQVVKAGGLGVSIPALSMTFLYCDSTDCFAPTTALNQVVGAIVDYAGATAPSGWLLCFGQAISRTTYSALFQAISTTYGVGDGSTTFNVPDCRGRVAAGKDDMGGADAARLSGGISARVTLGGTGGAPTTTLSTANLPAHSHTVSDPGHTHSYFDPSHTHATTDPSHAHATNAITAGGASAQGPGGQGVSTGPSGASVTASFTGLSINGAFVGISIQNAATGINSTNNTGGGNAFPAVPPAIIFNKIIYAGI
jgi:microcystin-dependent protein